MRYTKRKEIFWKKWDILREMRYIKRNEIHEKNDWQTEDTLRDLERLDILWETLNILEETRYFERLEIL